MEECTEGPRPRGWRSPEVGWVGVGGRARLYPEGLGRTQGESLGTFVPTGSVCQVGSYAGSVSKDVKSGSPSGQVTVWNGPSGLGFQVWRWLLSQGPTRGGLVHPVCEMPPLQELLRSQRARTSAVYNGL